MSTLKVIAIFVVFFLANPFVVNATASSEERQLPLGVTAHFAESVFDAWQETVLTLTVTNIGASDIVIPTSPNPVRTDIDMAPTQFMVAFIVSADDGVDQRVHTTTLYGSPHVVGSLVTLTPGHSITRQLRVRWALQPEFAASLLSQTSRLFNARVEIAAATADAPPAVLGVSGITAIGLKLPQ